MATSDPPPSASSDVPLVNGGFERVIPPAYEDGGWFDPLLPHPLWHGKLGEVSGRVGPIAKACGKEGTLAKRRLSSSSNISIEGRITSIVDLPHDRSYVVLEPTQSSPSTPVQARKPSRRARLPAADTDKVETEDDEEESLQLGSSDSMADFIADDDDEEDYGNSPTSLDPIPRPRKRRRASTPTPFSPSQSPPLRQSVRGKPTPDESVYSTPPASPGQPGSRRVLFDKRDRKGKGKASTDEDDDEDDYDYEREDPELLAVDPDLVTSIDVRGLWVKELYKGNLGVGSDVVVILPCEAGRWSSESTCTRYVFTMEPPASLLVYTWIDEGGATLTCRAVVTPDGAVVEGCVTCRERSEEELQETSLDRETEELAMALAKEAPTYVAGDGAPNALTLVKPRRNPTTSQASTTGNVLSSQSTRKAGNASEVALPGATQSFLAGKETAHRLQTQIDSIVEEGEEGEEGAGHEIGEETPFWEKGAPMKASRAKDIAALHRIELVDDGRPPPPLTFDEPEPEAVLDPSHWKDVNPCTVDPATRALLPLVDTESVFLRKLDHLHLQLFQPHAAGNSLSLYFPHLDRTPEGAQSTFACVITEVPVIKYHTTARLYYFDVTAVGAEDGAPISFRGQVCGDVVDKDTIDKIEIGNALLLANVIAHRTQDGPGKTIHSFEPAQATTVVIDAWEITLANVEQYAGLDNKCATEQAIAWYHTAARVADPLRKARRREAK